MSGGSPQGMKSNSTGPSGYSGSGTRVDALDFMATSAFKFCKLKAVLLFTLPVWKEEIQKCDHIAENAVSIP